MAVKRKYGLTVDAREACALEGVLAQRTSTEMVVTDGRKATPGASRQAAGQGDEPMRYGSGIQTGMGVSPAARRASTGLHP